MWHLRGDCAHSEYRQPIRLWNVLESYPIGDHSQKVPEPLGSHERCSHRLTLVNIHAGKMVCGVILSLCEMLAPITTRNYYLFQLDKPRPNVNTLFRAGGGGSDATTYSFPA